MKEIINMSFIVFRFEKWVVEGKEMQVWSHFRGCSWRDEKMSRMKAENRAKSLKALLSRERWGYGRERAEEKDIVEVFKEWKPPRRPEREKFTTIVVAKMKREMREETRRVVRKSRV